ncbi:hypothetical protein [Cellulomonas shaoxiangyii]|uniref:Uncharacterized protein n=1 Tax=Cellulomonas shaoxiangyii TaxID=2566013 RepID=A0A4V1CN20_9CELL|nr:hypothetical protein [Cellulomonas shaoxiangyii]QCB94915.1 hypothetical protein E5225_16435 [Cellulomonas shaoxiangyii]TGY77254.1 hypothetical protein E5226_17200 [Cellulomonas shaoxiangyii]
MSAGTERVRRTADRVRRAVGSVRPGAARRTDPSVTLRTGPAVHALVLRGALALAGLAAAATAAGGAVPTAVAVLLVVAGAAPAVWPRSVAPALLVLGLGVRVLVAGPPEAWRLALLVLLVHAVLWLAAVAARTGRRTRVELAVLRDAAPVALVVQAGAQVLALVAAALAGGATGGDGWRVAGTVAAAVVGALVLARPDEPWWSRASPDG